MRRNEDVCSRYYLSTRTPSHLHSISHSFVLPSLYLGRTGMTSLSSLSISWSAPSRIANGGLIKGSFTYPLKLPAPWGSFHLLQTEIAHVTQKVTKSFVFLRGKFT